MSVPNYFGPCYYPGTATGAYSDDGTEMSSPDAAAAEEAAGKDEGSDWVQRNADRIDWNFDEAGVAGKLGGHDDAERDQRQPSELYHRYSNTNLEVCGYTRGFGSGRVIN